MQSTACKNWMGDVPALWRRLPPRIDRRIECGKKSLSKRRHNHGVSSLDPQQKGDPVNVDETPQSAGGSVPWTFRTMVFPIQRFGRFVSSFLIVS